MKLVGLKQFLSRGAIAIANGRAIMLSNPKLPLGQLRSIADQMRYDLEKRTCLPIICEVHGLGVYVFRRYET